MNKNILPACSIFVLFLIFSAAAGCTASEKSSSEKETVHLSVAAASSFAQAATEIAERFEMLQGCAAVSITSASSGVLVQQVENGAPIDVLITADDIAMDRAELAGCLSGGSRRPLALNSLVLAAPLDSGLNLKSLADLKNNDFIKAAIGNPSFVPVGRYAKKALESQGLWEEFQDRLIYGNSARQVLDYIARGEIDVAFVFATDPPTARGKVKTLLTVPMAEEPRYSIALTERGATNSAASKFLEFASGSGGSDVITGYGFILPKKIMGASRADPR